MITKRTIGTWAAVGGFAATVALLTGLPATARADELSDLRTNNQLLQQRLDQISQTMAPQATAPMAASNVRGSFPRSFLVPGTDTSLAISGFISANVDYYISGGAQSGNSTTDLGEFGRLLSIPTGHTTPANGHTLTFSDQESRIRVESRTPTAWGPAGTVIEFDFNGGNNPGSAAGLVSGSSATLHPGESLTPRLRLAYGTWGNWLMGQAYSASTDLESHIDVIDFGGDVTTGGTVRVPQLRYTYDAGGGMSFATSIEAPDTSVMSAGGALDNSSGTGAAVTTTTTVLTPTGTATVSSTSIANNPTHNTVPDVFESFDWKQPWGHVRLTGVIRDLQFKSQYATGVVDRSYIGYGGWFTGNVLPGWFGWSRDFIGWGVTAGEGMGRYIGSQNDLTSNFTGSSAQAPGSILVTTNTSYGGYVGYKHWWAQEWASNFGFGLAHTDYNTLLLGSQSGAANKELVTAHANLFWYPTSFISVAAEYMYGHRQVASNAKADINVIEGQVQVKF